jgi:DNA-binding MarR family transcriptional regulator
MSDLAEQLLLTHHATVQLVNRMTVADLAVRRPSPTDRRSVHLVLTAQGEALVDKLATLHLREVLSQEAALMRSLRRLKRVAPDATA